MTTKVSTPSLTIFPLPCPLHCIQADTQHTVHQYLGPTDPIVQTAYCTEDAKRQELVHTALLHDQTIKRKFGLHLTRIFGSVRLRSQIEIRSLMAKTTTHFGLGSSSLLELSDVCNAASKRSDRSSNTCLGMKGCMAPRGSSICLSYSLTHNPGYPQWSLHHTDLV
jgi:hypothetical protein